MTQVAVSSPLGSRSISYQGFDPVGRERGRREVKDGAVGKVTTFAYDALGRLSSATKVSGPVTVFDQAFTYDALGNILTRTDSRNAAANVALSYLTTDRDRICRIGYGADNGTDCNVTYDEVGDVTTQQTVTGTRELNYLASGLVRNVTQDNTVARYRYDAFGEVQELDLESDTSLDTRRDRHYGELIALRNAPQNAASSSVIAARPPGQQQLLVRTVPGPHGFVATRRGAGGPWVFEFGEGRGNRFFTDQEGAFVQDVDYLPYGEPASTGASPGSKLYTSQQWNAGDALAALGVSQLGARMYDPVIGRFLSRDPLLVLRTSASTNPYAFAMNDPVNGADPGGLDCGESQCPQTPIVRRFALLGDDATRGSRSERGLPRTLRHR